MRLDELKKSLSDLFKEFAEFTKWKYGNSHEITIYSRLLQFEKSRLEERKETVVNNKNDLNLQTKFDFQF